MERCLYGEGGFYTSGRPTAQRRGSFITSPQVGPLFADVLSDWVQSVAAEQKVSRVFDIGSNTGVLAAGLRKNLETIEVVTVDHINAELTPEEFAEMSLDHSLIIGNELLDNLPCRILRQSPNGLEELFVDPLGTEEYGSWVQTSSVPNCPVVADTSKFPYQDSAREWVEGVLARSPVALLAFDYGAATTQELVDRGDWLRTYQNQSVGTDPFADPGERDITVDVAFDQLPAPQSLTTQAVFLNSQGIDALVEEGEEYWKHHAATPSIEALRMKSRASEAQALTDAKGLGSWLVAEWR